MERALSSETVREIGRYQLVAELARGGMGVVYLAATQGPGGFRKLLVIKELRPEYATDETYVAMFLDEARLAARLTHKNIVQTIEVGSEEGRHFMVMEHLDGRSLHRIAKRFSERGAFPLGAHLRVIAEALLGLQYAHELRGFDGEPLGMVHRDVSPLNVMVTFDGQVKVLDFGIAKSTESTLETKTGVLKGRVAYMAPEQAWGREVDRRADVYAAGVMIWEAAAGQRLWPGKNDVEILSTILREGTPRLRSVKPDASPELDALCARAMSRDPDQRHPSAAALLDDLESHLAKRPDAMSMRDVGGLVAAVFAEERRQMGTVIEETLAHARNHPHSGVMPTLEPRTRGTPSGRVGASTDPADSVSVSRTYGSISHRAAIAQPVIVAPSEEESVPPWRSKRGIALGLVGVALGVTIAAAMSSGHADPPRSPSEVRATPLPAAAAAAPAPDAVDFSVRVSPANASISVDGTPLSGNPFHGKVPRDGLVHHVSASADGFDPKVEDVSFGADLSVDLSLDRHAAPVVHWYVPTAPAHTGKHGATGPAASNPVAEAPPPPPPAAPAPAPARTDVGPAGGHAPLRPIMTSNPYGTP
jgi:serine/threonine-protein kinase